MKKLWVAAVATAMFLGIQAIGEVKSVNVVGVMSMAIPEGAESGFSYALVSVPMTKLPVARGTITANTASSITASGVNWDEDIFAAGENGPADESGVSTYYAEITSGVFEGRHFYIEGNTSDTLMLVGDMGDIEEGDLVETPSVGFKIIPANRIRDVFGEPGEPSLVGGTSTDNADTLQLWTGSAWGNHIIHHSTPQRWVQLGVGGGFADDRPIDRDEGILIRRLPDTEQVNITLAGEVSGNAQTVVLEPGYNLVGGALVLGRALDDEDSGLRQALQAGTSTDNADTIQAWESGIWGNHILLHSTPDRWVKLGGGGFADDYVLDPTKSYLFHLKGSRVWQRPSALVGNE